MSKKQIAILIILSIAVIPFYTYANVHGSQLLDNLFKWLCHWVGRIGLIVAFFGAIQVALGFYRNDPDGKIMGLKTLASGFMVYGISLSPHLFGM